MPNPPDLEQFVRAVEDATTFPVLTEPVSSRTGTSSGGRTPAGTSSLGSMVRNTLHEVLSWRPNATDVKGLKEALLYSFSAKELSGRTVYDHVPRSYIMQVQSDGGAVTGAQASIYARAKAAVDQSLPLLEGLYPLTPDSDREDLAAVRSTLRMAFLSLVEELGRVGGPRIQRVDTTFRQLLGDAIVAAPPAQFDVDEVGGQLGLLRDRLGLEIERVNFSEEEKNLTNLHILADHAFTLLLSWNSVRHYFDWTGNDVFLGPQLVLLSRALRVVAESVHETYSALDSVFVGAAERQVILLRFENGESPLTLADLLEWVDTFAATEGPRLIQEAGKDGVISFRSTLTQLSGLVEEAVKITRKNANNPTRGVHTLRVSTALEGVLLHLNTTLDLASPFSRLAQPEIDAIDPEEVVASPLVQLRIEGENFDRGATVEITLFSNSGEALESRQADRVHFASETTLFAFFNLLGASAGDWTVLVRNADGVESDDDQILVVQAGLLLANPPEIDHLELPDVILPGDQDVVVEIFGNDFQEDIEIEVSGEGISFDGEAIFHSPNHLTVRLDVDEAAAAGARTLTVTNPDGQQDDVPLEIDEVGDDPDFVFLSIEPNRLKRGERKKVTIKGKGFDASVSGNFGNNINTKSLKVVDSETIEISPLWVRKHAEDGPRTIRLVKIVGGKHVRAFLDTPFTVD